MILIYAINRDSPMHEPAQSWLNKQLSAGKRIGLPWLVIADEDAVHEPMLSY